MDNRLERMFEDCKKRQLKKLNKITPKPKKELSLDEKILRRMNKLAYHYHWHDVNTYKFDCENELDGKWIMDNILPSGCIYCGETDWHKLGCDRIDNTKPHTKDNVVCCCKRCNTLRSNKFTVDEMKEIGAVIKRIEKRHKSYYKRRGKKVACYSDNGELLKEYPCAEQVQEDGYNPKVVRRACVTEDYRYKGMYWKYIN